MDHFYGLKEYYGIATFYDLLFEKSSIFLSTEPKIFDGALGQLLHKSIDELHTSMVIHHTTMKLDMPDKLLQRSTTFGPKVGGWYQNSLWPVEDAISSKWGSTAARPNYWFLNTEKLTELLL